MFSPAQFPPIFGHFYISPPWILPIYTRCMATRLKLRSNHISESQRRFSKDEYILNWKSYSIFNAAQFPHIFGDFGTY